MSSSLERLTVALAEQYVIERELGAGGMATVYLARDARHRRRGPPGHSLEMVDFGPGDRVVITTGAPNGNELQRIPVPAASATP